MDSQVEQPGTAEWVSMVEEPEAGGDLVLASAVQLKRRVILVSLVSRLISNYA
jgi:hypothetical protein